MKKIKVLALFLCMAFCTVFFTACGNNLTAPTGTGNMVEYGEVLVYDDYIYFGGMYISNADMENGDNRNADLEGLWRIKLEDGKISYDEDGNPQNLEKVVGKIVGTENAFMYSVGDEIVFASPNVKLTQQSQTAFDRTTYFKMSNVGTGLTELYTTEAAVQSQALLIIDNVPYIIVYDGTNIVKINVNTKASKVLATDVTSAAFASSYSSAFDGDIYFTVNLSEEDTSIGLTGNILKKVNIVSEEETQVRQQYGETITVNTVKNGYLYYTRTDNGNTFYFANNFTSSFEAGEVQLTSAITSDITSFTPLGLDQEGNVLPIVFEYQSRLVYSNFGSLVVNEILNEDVTVLFESGDYIYYSTSSGIYRVSYKDKVSQQISDLANFQTNVTFDGRYIYFYAQNEDNTTGNYYMYRADVNAAENGTGIKTELLSKLHEDDIPDEDEETSDTSTDSSTSN